MNLLNANDWARAIRDPVVLTGIAVDLAPVYAVVAWGWGAAPLVMLYWVENVIAGVMTLPRIIISGARFGAVGGFAGLFMSAFFIFHYGLFCAVHGTFLFVFVAATNHAVPGIENVPVMDIPGMVGAALTIAPHMDLVFGLIVGWQAFVLLYQFILKGDWRQTNPAEEMFAPYSRIVVLHIGIFAGAGALFLLGDPMVGVLALIFFRAVWGVYINARGGRAGLFATATGKIDFEKMLKTGDGTPDDPDGRQ
jgi:hypothetical protein